MIIERGELICTKRFVIVALDRRIVVVREGSGFVQRVAKIWHM